MTSRESHDIDTMPRKPQDHKQQLFVFTINNPLKWQEQYNGVVDDALASLVLLQRKLTYIGFEHEVGESGTPHIQGFFRTAIRVCPNLAKPNEAEVRALYYLAPRASGLTFRL